MFKSLFKYYKRKCPAPDFAEVLQIDKGFDEVLQKRCPYSISKDLELELRSLGLKPSSSWQIFELTDHPGLIIVKNPFYEEGADEWIKKCLSEYPGPPNLCNLHAHDLLLPEEHWWQVCQIDSKRKAEIFYKLRWVTLGYHHDWETKTYSENRKSKFPNELSSLVSGIGEVVGGGDDTWRVRPQAAIINIYHMDSTLSPHTDHSEPNISAPLFSISFGQQAVFLIGGYTLEDKVTPLMIQHGDIVIMSGESRHCYHAVPKIVSTPWPVTGGIYSDYLATARINLNLRQVLSRDEEELHSQMN